MLIVQILFSGVFIIVAATATATSTTATENFTLENENGSVIGAAENQRIVGGTHVGPNELPYQVFLQITINDGVKFQSMGWGGTIISTKFIITAAHCMYKQSVEGEESPQANTEDILVYIGIVDLKLRQPDTAARVNRMIIHKKYNSSTTDYDIALIELCEPLTLTKSVNILPVATTENIVFRRVEVSGWGQTAQRGPFDPAGRERVTLLSKVTMDLVTRKCQNMYSTYKSTGKKEQALLRKAIIPLVDICAVGDNKGGPLACHLSTYPFQKRLCGVVSSGLGCAWPGLPGVFVNTRNVEVNNWIYKNAKVSKGRKADYCILTVTGDIIPNK